MPAVAAAAGRSNSSQRSSCTAGTAQDFFCFGQCLSLCMCMSRYLLLVYKGCPGGACDAIAMFASPKFDVELSYGFTFLYFKKPNISQKVLLTAHLSAHALLQPHKTFRTDQLLIPQHAFLSVQHRRIVRIECLVLRGWSMARHCHSDNRRASRYEGLPPGRLTVWLSAAVTLSCSCCILLLIANAAAAGEAGEQP